MKLFSFLWKYWLYIFIPVFICDCSLSYSADIHAKQRITGRYFLYCATEGGPKHYYLHKGIWDMSPRGVFDGIIQEIGWNKDWIVVKVKRLCGIDPSGWYVLDVKRGSVMAPITYENLAKNTNWDSIKCVPVSEAYEKLVRFLD